MQLPSFLAIADRYQRLAFAVACSRRSDAVVDLWLTTMLDPRAEMTHRIACSVHLMNRAHGLPVQVAQEADTGGALVKLGSER